jgi:hypothetical protein
MNVEVGDDALLDNVNIQSRSSRVVAGGGGVIPGGKAVSIVVARVRQQMVCRG